MIKRIKRTIRNFRAAIALMSLIKKSSGHLIIFDNKRNPILVNHYGNVKNMIIQCMLKDEEFAKIILKSCKDYIGKITKKKNGKNTRTKNKN